MKTAFLLFVFLIACQTPPELVPSSGPGTLYPCGVDGVQCRGAMCCSEGFTCGGAFPSIGCPEGWCCFIGAGVTRGDAGVTMRRQTPATSEAR